MPVSAWLDISKVLYYIYLLRKGQKKVQHFLLHVFMQTHGFSPAARVVADVVEKHEIRI